MFYEKMNRIAEVLKEAKILAREYREIRGKPLGITGEVGEFSAVQLLDDLELDDLELAPARQSGYDAIRQQDGKITKIQIKSRCVPSNSNPNGRLGSIKLDNDFITNDRWKKWLA